MQDDLFCAACNKRVQNHSLRELWRCAATSGERTWEDSQTYRLPTFLFVEVQKDWDSFTGVCAHCGKQVYDHTTDEMRACAQKSREKAKDVRCPICNKLVLEHSYEENLACSAKR